MLPLRRWIACTGLQGGQCQPNTDGIVVCLRLSFGDQISDTVFIAIIHTVAHSVDDPVD